MKTCFQKGCRFIEYTKQERFVGGKEIKFGYRDDFVRGVNIFHSSHEKAVDRSAVKHSLECRYGEPERAVGKTLYWDGRP